MVHILPWIQQNNQASCFFFLSYNALYKTHVTWKIHMFLHIFLTDKHVHIITIVFIPLPRFSIHKNTLGTRAEYWYPVFVWRCWGSNPGSFLGLSSRVCWKECKIIRITRNLYALDTFQCWRLSFALPWCFAAVF